MEYDRPKLAIVDNNTLAAMGLKQILLTAMPISTVDVYGSFAELQASDADSYFHYFVSTNILLENRAFFMQRQRKTIVLTSATSAAAQISDFHSLCVNVPEQQLVKALLNLEQQAHAHGRNLPPVPSALEKHLLSDREIEVLSLVAQGYMNKEIADMLNIGQTTVVTHRKNIVEKLGLRTVSALTIYAVMHGYVDINKI